MVKPTCVPIWWSGSRRTKFKGIGQVNQSNENRTPQNELTLIVPSRVLAMTTLFRESVAIPLIDLSLRLAVPE